MIDVKEAAAIAQTYLKDLYKGRQLGTTLVEEVELHSD